MLKQEIRRVLHSPFFYVSIIILVFADFPVMLDQFEMSNELTYLVDVGWGMGYGSVLYPLLCVLTTAESYLMEYRSGYRYSSMSRTSKTRYAVTKMAVAIGTGAAIAVLSRLLFLGLTALIFITLQWYYGSPLVLMSTGRASLLPYKGLPFRVIMVLLYWVVEMGVFVYGVRKQTE